MAQGYFQLDRGVWERLGREVEPLQRLVLTHMMQAANHSPGRKQVFVPGEGPRALRAGELVTSCGRLGEETGLSDRTVRRYLAAFTGRWSWLTVRLCPGRAGAAGVFVAIDFEASRAWGAEDRTQSPVSGGPDTESGLDRSGSPVSPARDRSQSPIQEERRSGERSEEQARRSKTASSGQSRARARSTDDNGSPGAKQRTTNGERQRPPAPREWDSITASWPCRDKADRVARERAERVLEDDPVRALAIAKGVQRSRPRREWLTFNHRCSGKAFPVADEDVREASRELDGARSGGTGTIGDAIDSALAHVAGARDARPPP